MSGGRLREQASAQAMAFLVAGSVFTVAMAGVIYNAQSGPASTAGAERAVLQQQSGQLMDALLRGQGPKIESGFTLALGAQDGVLDPLQVDRLRGAMVQKTPNNGRIDYEEATASLGIEDLDFHLRMAPLQDTKAELENVDLLYIGHYPPSPALPPFPREDPTDVVDSVRLNYRPEAGVVEEIALVDALGTRFNPSLDLNTTTLDNLVVGYPPGLVALPTFIHAEAPPPPGEPGLLDGDVLMDKAAYLIDVLPNRLHGADVLMVGSTVDHAALNAQGIPELIRDWILGGGTMLVLGSGQMTTDWLLPLWAAGKQTVNQIPHEPYPEHAILHVPNYLDWTTFEGATSKNMIYTDEAWSYHDHVLVRFGAASKLAISRDGAFGAGRVVVSSFIPPYLLPHEFQAEKEAGQASSEPIDFLENVVMFLAHPDYFLEYGKPPPVDADVAASQRIVHMTTESGDAAIRLTVVAWEK